MYRQQKAANKSSKQGEGDCVDGTKIAAATEGYVLNTTHREACRQWSSKTNIWLFLSNRH